jgi:hypothetical protein
MSQTSPLEVLVLVSNTDDFHGWSQEKKVERYERVLEWHDFVRTNKSRIPYVWGTHQALSQNSFCKIRSMHVLVYRVQSLFELDELMDRDPLRDVSQYMTWLLSPLEDDLTNDLRRIERLRAELGSGKGLAENKSWNRLRALYSGAPDFVGKYEPIAPPNKPKDYSDPDDGKIEILVCGTNTPDSMTWSDAKQLIVYEKVIWWADYTWMLIHRGQVKYGWNFHDFCDSAVYAGNTAGAALVYWVSSLEEFDSLYSLDPVRRKGNFWSIVLQPIARQEEVDKQRLKEALARLRRQRAGALRVLEAAE